MKTTKNRINILLQKDGEQDITVTCPEKIKLSFFQTILELRYGLPPLDIKPFDKKGLAVLLGGFASIFLAAYMIEFSIFLLLLIGSLIIWNFYITQNYFFNFLQEKLSDGYVVKNEATIELLTKANVFPLPIKETQKKKKVKFLGIMGGSVGILLLLALVFSRDPIDKFLDEFEDGLDNIIALYDDIENGNITKEEAMIKILEITKNMEQQAEEISNYDDNMTKEQIERFFLLMKKMANIDKYKYR